MGNKVTIKDVIQATYNELKRISIPASIGSSALLNLSVPIGRAMSNLEICLQAIEEDARKEQEPEMIVEEEIVPSGPPSGEGEPISPPTEEVNG